ncbi:unnamed protein product [Closterium sp. NIES-64]|nr:unnamed protein product [Closterium sp. NIES-64]
MLAAFLAALVFFHSSEFLLALCLTIRFPQQSTIFVSREELPFTTLQANAPPLPHRSRQHHPSRPLSLLISRPPTLMLLPSAPHCPAPFCGPWRFFRWCLRTYQNLTALLCHVPQVVFENSQEPSALLWSPAATGRGSPPPASHAAFLVSWEYLLAMEVALTEYALETALFPAFKRRLWPMAWVGGALLLVGEAVHKAAMVTARRSFTHAIQMEKRREHRLVTYGLYRWVRHPGYMGWFIWTMATQLLDMTSPPVPSPRVHVPMFPTCPHAHGRWVRHPGYTGWFMWSIAMQLQLVNPLCTLAFALVSWRFFAARIPSLPRYAASVSFAIPFVSSAPTSARLPLLSLFPPAATS